MVGNPFPVIEHPFDNDKPINPGYQFHFALGIFFKIYFINSLLIFFFLQIKEK